MGDVRLFLTFEEVGLLSTLAGADRPMAVTLANTRIAHSLVMRSLARFERGGMVITRSGHIQLSVLGLAVCA